MRNNTPPKRKMIGTSAKDLVAQSRAEAARANAAKVAANAAKVAANAKKVKANATAKAKVTPKVTATKAAAPKVKMATAVPTPRAIATSGKTYLLETNKFGKQWGTAEQQDSLNRADALWNEGGKIYPGTDRRISGVKTKQGYDREMASFAKNPKMLAYLTGPGKKKREDLPDYVPSKNTGAGKLLRKPEFKGVTGRGGCLPGYSLDKNGRCVKSRLD